MTTNKPEVFTFNSLSEECVRLSDYEVLQAELSNLQAECDRLTDALESIARPICHLRRHIGEDEDLALESITQQLAKDPFYLRALAAAALEARPAKEAPTHE